ncbi:MAG TPA: PilZ domain-containing protein [Vicinamibacteria bacterium]|nr:PilZ domain-containing protein [Vicinamibacteria bacterium]
MERDPDQRRYERFKLRVPLYISMESQLFHKKIHLESKDVSAGGVSFETSREIPLEAESRVVVSNLGDLTPPTFIRGRVAHLKQDPATGRYTVGIEFTEFVNTTREEIVARIEAWQRTAVPPSPS